MKRAPLVLFSWYSSKAMEVNLLHEMPRLCRRLLAYADVVPLQLVLEINLRCQSQTSLLERHWCAMNERRSPKPLRKVADLSTIGGSKSTSDFVAESESRHVTCTVTSFLNCKWTRSVRLTPHTIAAAATAKYEIRMG